MKKQIVRHDHGTDRSHGLTCHVRLSSWNRNSLQNTSHIRFCHHKCDPETYADRTDKYSNKGLEFTYTERVKTQKGKGIESRDETSHVERKAKENSKRNRRTHNFLNIRSHDGKLRTYPKCHRNGFAVSVFLVHTHGSQILSRRHSESRRENLKKQSECCTPKQNPKNFVSSVRSLL